MRIGYRDFEIRYWQLALWSLWAAADRWTGGGQAQAVHGPSTGARQRRRASAKPTVHKSTAQKVQTAGDGADPLRSRIERVIT